MSAKIDACPASHREAAMPPCPVCGSSAQPIRTVTPELIRRTFAAYFRGECNLAFSADMAAYRILRCRECTLEFANPPLPGSSRFYAEIGKQAGYYPGNRWEWGVAVDELGKSSVGVLVEVGCGSGAFLKKAADALGCRATGIDTNPDAAVKCSVAGLNVYCESIEEHCGRFAAPPYDCAVSFHCLEHVEKPLAFARSLFSLVRPGGLVLLSTPLSPMSFERVWHDPLNNPPHHLTRWNERAYRELARRLHADVRLFSPPAAGRGRLAAHAVALANHGTPRTVGRLEVWAAPVLHPMEFLRELVYQRHRRQPKSRLGGDVILGVFRKP